MGIITKIIIGVVAFFFLFGHIFLASALSIEEFKELTDEELQEWNYEYIETTYEGIDTVTHFEMDVYRYYQPANTMRLVRESFSFALCYHEHHDDGSPTSFNDELAILQTSIFNEYKELQDEL